MSSPDQTPSAGPFPTDGDPVPEPAAGVRGADAAERMDADPGHGTTTGADGETAAREALRTHLRERPASAGTETGDDAEQAAALGATDDPQGGSIQQDGARTS